MDQAALRESYETNSRLYELHLSDSPPDLPFWDLLVITASDKQQCEHYRATCEHRVQAGTLPARLKVSLEGKIHGPTILVSGAYISRSRGLQGRICWRHPPRAAPVQPFPHACSHVHQLVANLHRARARPIPHPPAACWRLVPAAPESFLGGQGDSFHHRIIQRAACRC